MNSKKHIHFMRPGIHGHALRTLCGANIPVSNKARVTAEEEKCTCAPCHQQARRFGRIWRANAA